MNSAVLDRLDSQLEKEKSNAQSSWLELVRLSAEGGRPDEIFRRFRDSGKSRKELERDVALLLEYGSLQATVAKIPQLQTKEAELGEQFSAALRAREAAEEAAKVALQKAHENLSKADAAHKAATSQSRQARQAKQQLNDPRFNFLKGMERMSVRGQEISREIKEVEGKLEALASRIHESKSKLSRYDAEWMEVSHSDETNENKNVQRLKLQAGIQGANDLIFRYDGEERDLQKQLLSLRKELAAEKSESQWSQW